MQEDDKGCGGVALLCWGGWVTSPRGVLHSAVEEKPRLRRKDATKAPSTADAAFTRSRRIQWIYSTLAWGKL